ncbi:MAG: hypothetical protein IPJ88_15735 [Myxococcales bacterium]|nr:MAG: hypothetical protein IPJ88_15735 [Myxococcales bacterium]
MAIDIEFSIHGFVNEAGEYRIGDPVEQIVDEHGVWRSGQAAEAKIFANEEGELREQANNVAKALHRAGYFGPFGIDAYRYRKGKHMCFQPRSEINARYTMTWGIAGGALYC